MSDALSEVCVAIIDDDPSFCRSLRGFLLAAGIRTVVYHSAEAFLADAKRPRFDCLLLDIQLGGMSGIELSQRLTRDGSITPVILNTGQDDPDTSALALRSGCAAYLLKTDPGQAVLDIIRNTIAPEAANRLESGRQPSTLKTKP